MIWSEISAKVKQIAAILLLGSCGPQGELTRTLHPPHQDTKAVSKSEPMSLAARDTGLEGLPATCLMTQSPEPLLCINCQQDSILVHRCYDIDGLTIKHCRYDGDTIKCLDSVTLSGLSLGYRGSLEKALRESFLTWRETTDRIWLEKLDAAEHAELQNLYKALDQLTGALTSQLQPSPELVAELTRSLGIPEGRLQAELQSDIREFFDARKNGNLSFARIFEVTDELTSEAHPQSTLWPKLRSMSLEGLDPT